MREGGRGCLRYRARVLVVPGIILSHESRFIVTILLLPLLSSGRSSLLRSLRISHHLFSVGPVTMVRDRGLGKAEVLYTKDHGALT